jgi:hypothetical protein
MCRIPNKQTHLRARFIFTAWSMAERTALEKQGHQPGVRYERKEHLWGAAIQ